MSIIHLVTPDEAYRSTYLAAIREYRAEGLESEYDLPRAGQLFKAFVKGLQKPALKSCQVPYSVFWLIDGEEYIGRLTLRHELDEDLQRRGGHIGFVIRPSKRRKGYGREILRQGLFKAAAQGLDKVLVTCRVDNAGSRRIIEANGGVFENQSDKDLRFWITLPKPKGPKTVAPIASGAAPDAVETPSG